MLTDPYGVQLTDFQGTCPSDRDTAEHVAASWNEGPGRGGEARKTVP